MRASKDGARQNSAKGRVSTVRSQACAHSVEVHWQARKYATNSKASSHLSCHLRYSKCITWMDGPFEIRPAKESHARPSSHLKRRVFIDRRWARAVACSFFAHSKLTLLLVLALFTAAAWPIARTSGIARAAAQETPPASRSCSLRADVLAATGPSRSAHRVISGLARCPNSGGFQLPVSNCRRRTMAEGASWLSPPILRRKWIASPGILA